MKTSTNSTHANAFARITKLHNIKETEMKMYHGTTEERAEYIESEGFRGSELSEMTDGFTTLNNGGVVFVTDSIEEAKGYGNAVFEIELLNESPIFFQDAQHSNAKEYYIPVSIIQEDGIYNRVS